MKEKEETEISKAVKVLTQAIKEDPDFYIAYQANIAMQFYDEYRRRRKDKGSSLNITEVHEVANQGAKNFIDLWVR